MGRQAARDRLGLEMLTGGGRAMPSSHNPRTREEWQEAADAAHVLLTVDAARQYGLIEGGPEIDQERCVEILRLAKRRRITPAKDCIERAFGAAGQSPCRN